MFRAANVIARQFTKPVVTSFKTVAGKCAASIGSFVVINDEGWIVTAYHIVEQLQKLTTTAEEVKNIQTQRAAVENDATLGSTQKRKQLNKLPRIEVVLVSETGV